MTTSLGKVTDPKEVFNRVYQSSIDDAALFSFEHSQDYLETGSKITLHCVVANIDGHTWCRISDEATSLDHIAKDPATLAESEGAIDFSKPLALTPVRIPKPWGAEIWFTGIEERGVSCIGDTPIAWVIDLAGDACCGTKPPLLLKILDPLPDEHLGDLYFELHEEKVEVYVVTSIDSSAWPDGTGYIRYGFNEEELARHESREAFKQGYLAAVTAYQEARQEIDQLFDQYRSTEGMAANEVIEPDRARAWRNRLPGDLIEREESCLAKMNNFTTLEPLVVGDIVRVTPFTPHSLQHGVRVVEFQTPHYERYILSFGQKVLTQDHWDTASAIEKVDWQARFDKRVEKITSTDAFTADRVADFEAFKVIRLTLPAGGSFVQDLNTYALVMGIEGEAIVNDAACGNEKALLVPRLPGRLDISSDEGCCLLLAYP